MQDAESVKSFLLAVIDEFSKRHHFVSKPINPLDVLPLKPRRSASAQTTQSSRNHTPHSSGRRPEQSQPAVSPYELQPVSPAFTSRPCTPVIRRPLSVTPAPMMRLMNSEPARKRARLTSSVVRAGGDKSRWIDELIAVWMN
jgi:hypothetical protein